MDELEKGYEQIIQAENFVKNFRTLKDFEIWASHPEATKEDLKACLEVFEQSELYEHCAILKRLYDER